MSAPSVTPAPHPADPPVDRLSLPGHLTRDQVHLACLRLASRPQPPARLLVDLRDSPVPRSEADRVFLACNLVVFFHRSAVAVLARKENITHVLEGVAASARMELALFWKEEAALAWLAGRTGARGAGA